MDGVGATLAEQSEHHRLAAVTAGRYEIQAEIGRGGMSRVFRAWDLRARRLVAIKLLAAGLSVSVEHRERFRREASITSRLAHPNILACYDFVRSGDVVFAVMPYAAGSSLAERLAMPFPGGSPLAHAAQRTVLDAPPLRRVAPEVPGRLAAVVDRCLAREPNGRWRSAAALRGALERVGRTGPRGLGRWLTLWRSVG